MVKPILIEKEISALTKAQFFQSEKVKSFSLTNILFTAIKNG